MSNCVTVTNVVAIGQTVVEIFRLWIFQDGGSHHLGFFLNFTFLTIGTVKKDELRHCAKFCQNRSNHGGDMSFFDFSRWRLPQSWIFEISKIFNGWNGQKGPTASSCQISSESLETRLRYNNFFDFTKMAVVRHLVFVMRVWGPPTKGIWRSLSLCKIWLESMQ